MSDAAATTCAKSELWLALNPLNRYTVLDYFAITHFYEREHCVNEDAVAAGRHRSDTAGLPCGPERFEYVVVDAAEPALYVIQKQQRGLSGSGADAPRRLAIFYVLDGAIYQAPSLHAVFASRLSRCAFNLRSAFGLLQERLTALGADAPAAEAAAAGGSGGEESAPPAEVAASAPAATAAAAPDEEKRMAAFVAAALKAYDATPGAAEAAAHLQALAQAQAAAAAAAAAQPAAGQAGA